MPLLSVPKFIPPLIKSSTVLIAYPVGVVVPEPPPKVIDPPFSSSLEPLLAIRSADVLVSKVASS